MTKTQTDIIFIVLDTQRADRLGCYGYDNAISPNLDRFAANANLFEQAVAPAQWTVPSHASMFSGLYPTSHQVLQSAQRLSPNYPHVSELLASAGYETVGFCNNPLVGILDNGLKRGFQQFYNYGGAVPSVPRSSSPLPRPFNTLAEAYTQALRRLSYPVQNFFGRSDLAFQISLNAWLTPLWSKMANFKGQNERSVKDVVHFLQEREKAEAEKPLFLFLNLMETHLPFWPPGQYIDQVAPYFRESKEARTIMRNWNREAYRWAAPLNEPHSELEHNVLNDLYDAEVAYQDDYLGSLLEMIAQRSRKADTLTIIVADHGDGLGDHGYMGHAFVAYEELIHVPLILDWPAAWPQGARIDTPVSTRRVFHTMLDAANVATDHVEGSLQTEIKRLSLGHTIEGSDPEAGTAFAEVYPPLNFVKAIEKRQPELLDAFRCLDERHAVVQQSAEQTFKLIQLERRANELYDLRADALELDNLLTEEPHATRRLSDELMRAQTRMKEKQVAGSADDLEVAPDSQLMQRLRGLGYLD